MKYFWIASAFFGILTGTAAPAQQTDRITIYVIDITNGKPATQRNVWIEGINPSTHMPIIENGMPLKGKTNADGKVSFPIALLHGDLPADQSGDQGTAALPRTRLSKLLDVQITYAGGGIQCSTGLFSLNDIQKSGVVGDNRCKKQINLTKFKVSPGEVIIFVGKYHWWDAGQT